MKVDIKSSCHINGHKTYNVLFFFRLNLSQDKACTYLVCSYTERLDPCSLVSFFSNMVRNSSGTYSMDFLLKAKCVYTYCILKKTIP